MAGIAMKWASPLLKRDEQDDSHNGIGSFDENDEYDDYYDGYSWWWSPTGMAVRYTIISLIFASILLYFVGGYLHAIRRVRKGLPPKPYHAWMVRRYYPQPQQNPYYQQAPYAQEAYAMPTYAQPPPAYNPYAAPPPAYQPPEGASKALADQNFYSGQTYRAEEHGEGSQSVGTPAATARQRHH